MNRQTRSLRIAGPAGVIEAEADDPAEPPKGIAVLCHPHPQHGGTMANKVVQTLARAFVQLGYCALRFNFRGVGESQGRWGEGVGEVDDALAVVEQQREAGLPVALGGFSFGGYVAASAAAALRGRVAIERLLLVAPATSRFNMPAVPADTIVIHGETDDVVPLASTLAWARAQTLPVIVLPGVGHFFHGQLTLLKSQVMQAWHR